MTSWQIPELISHVMVSVMAGPSTIISASCTDWVRQNEKFT